MRFPDGTIWKPLIPALVVASLAVSGGVSAQVRMSPATGITDRTPRLLVLDNARLVVRPGQIVDNGRLVVRDGVIVASGANVKVPAGAHIVDVGGRSVYAGFIDANSSYGLPADAKPDVDRPSGRTPFVAPSVDGARHWNRKVRPELDVSEQLKPDAKRAEVLRRLGFTSVVALPSTGVLRGQGALLSTAPAERLNDVLIAPRVIQSAAFEFNRGSDEYPASLMGSIALLRQVFLDAQWLPRRLAWQQRHRDAERVEVNAALDALVPVVSGRQPIILFADDELDVGRAQRIADEFKLDAVIGGNGYEYRQIARIKAAGRPLIVPLSWPDAPAIEDPDRALDVSLAELEHWEWAPFNLRVLAENAVPFALTGAGLKKPEAEFWARLRQSVANGLGEEAALAALTTTPAAIIGQSGRIGSLEPGKLANFVVADHDLFRSKDARIREVWIAGKRLPVEAIDAPDVRGEWKVSWTGADGPSLLRISGDNDLSVEAGSSRFPAVVSGGRLLLYPPGNLFRVPVERLTLSAAIDGGVIEGRSVLPDGRELAWNGRRERPFADVASGPVPPLPPSPRYPAGEFGRTAVPAQAFVLIRGATLWTQSAQGRLDAADLLIRGGRIAAIGSGLAVPRDAQVIDGKGLHVSPGIIDAHSHVAISRGVNEGSHAVTSEVRVGDVLDPTDISIYRQLAGGVTTSHLMHGSANPIGGQSQIIKLRWGSDADGLRFAGAPASIKFALGENVKQSNWGPAFTTRYPQTRMGVPQLVRDQFNAARDHATLAKDKGVPIRRDLRLEALAEILAGQRTIHVHSYRQDEILAFVRIAQDYRFTPVFQHILEGYKVADELASIDAGASTFADWWAYKMEVVDAIPHNGALMTRRNVVVSFNSDDAELARRLNSDAAKAVKYGGLAETEALDLVTRNPARQLRIDDRIGSLEVGKDADFAIWNDSPLSTLAVPQQTWIDGRKYFDRGESAVENARIDNERTRLVAKLLPERIKALARRDARSVSGDGERKALPKDIAITGDGAHVHVDDALAREMRAPYHDGEPVHVCREVH